MIQTALYMHTINSVVIFLEPLFEQQGACGNKKVIKLESYSLGGGGGMREGGKGRR